MKKVKLFIFLVLSFCFSVLIATGEEAHAADMHRLYNPNSGEHFYTATTGEKNHLVKVGWRYEGIGWIAPSSGHAVYRLYNPNAGDHHYTMNANEKNHLVKVGWRYEGIGWYSDTKMTVPLYRAYNPNAKAGSHNYTVNYAEQKNLLRVGWRDEGIAWYGIKKTTPVTKYTVTVRHIGSDGKTLKSATTQVEKGKSYTAKAASFSGYTLKGSSSQTVTVNGNKTITFNYTKNTVAPTKYTVTVKYVDIAGKEIEKATTASVEKGKSYTATAKSIAGYTAKTPTSQKITVNGNQTVTFKYTKNATPGTKYIVTVKYVDKNGKNIRPASRQTVEEGKTFTAEAQEIPDYTVQGNGSQVIKSVNKDETIIFVYTSNSIVEYKITVKYVDEGGNSIKTATTHTIGYGEQFSMTAPTITGYTVKAADKTKDIASVSKNETVTFTYTKNKYTITAKYVDEGGNSIKSTTTHPIEYGKPFSMTAPAITGYTVKAADKTKNIASVSKNETVTFTYTKNKYTITAKYVDESGNSIKSTTTHPIEYGKPFSMTAPAITGYTVKTADKTKNIASVSKNETVTFTYTKNAPEKYTITVKYVDESGKEIKTATTANVEKGQPYSITAPAITGYTVVTADKIKNIAAVSKNETLTIKYTKNTVKYNVKVIHKGNDGESLGIENFSVEAGTKYIANSKTFNGYKLSGNLTQNVVVTKDTEITFIYNNLAFDVILIDVIADGTFLKTVTKTVQPNEAFKVSNQILGLDPKEFDLALTFYYNYTGVGGVTRKYTINVSRFLVRYVPDSELPIMQKTIFNKVNELRASLGVAPLKEDTQLNAIAAMRSDETKSLFSHTRPNGTSFSTAIDEKGITYSHVGENLARTPSQESSGQKVGEAMFNQWKASKGHYDNMVNPSYQYLGIGLHVHGVTVYGTQLFIRK